MFGNNPGDKTSCKGAAGCRLARPPLVSVRAAVGVSRCKPGDHDVADWQAFFDSDELGIPEGILDIPLPAVNKSEPEGDGAVAGAVAGNCYGCGAPLQTGTPDTYGYVDPEVYFHKLHHKQLHNILCSRCAAWVYALAGLVLLICGMPPKQSTNKQTVSSTCSASFTTAWTPALRLQMRGPHTWPDGAGGGGLHTEAGAARAGRHYGRDIHELH